MMSIWTGPATLEALMLDGYVVIPDMALRMMTPSKPASFAMVLAPPPRMKKGRFLSFAKAKAAGTSS